MQRINELTPQVTGKSTDPDWFLLRQHFEFKEAELTRLRVENEKLRRVMYEAWKTLTEFGSPKDESRVGWTLKAIDAAIQAEKEPTNKK
jgi:regulator of replication initiation timing